MTITLAEALPIRASIQKRIQELSHELDRASVVTYQKGERYHSLERTVEEILTDIREAYHQQMTLDSLLARANQEATLEWDGEQITVAWAIETAKNMRNELQIVKRLAMRRKEELLHAGSGSLLLMATTTYEPAEYQKKAMQLERKVNKLSSLIDRSNMDTEIDFDASAYFGE